MSIKDLFVKPIDRKIEGVIQADDARNLLQEIDEYVVTKEIKSQLESFLDAYTNNNSMPGVWISGFFGSGKSHLLKMISLLLEGWKHDGISILDMFLDKCKDEPFLCGNLRKVTSIPARSILFNIDLKADIKSKEQSDAILSVFVKVFNETCGYYGKHGYIAKFERDLDMRGLFEGFKDKYHEISGKEWKIGRAVAALENQNIAQAYAAIANVDVSSVLGLLDKYQKDYTVSIEEFSNDVNEYIKKQGDNFRLIFCVDEVGQYIANNTNLMLNLQTISETFYSLCKGRAWIIVTSQSDLQTMLGHIKQAQSTEYGRITARFPIKMNLSGANVEEVLQKRLLEKKEDCIDPLLKIYHKYKDSFKVLFHLADGAKTYRGFVDSEDFTRSYPFIPYQAFLLQTAFISLSENDAFPGKYTSVGTRSLLSIYQHVVNAIGSKDVGTIASFDLMYEGFQSMIKPHLLHTIHTAEGNLNDEFAVRVLKVLFVVKYVRDFKATVRNLRILMMEGFDDDIPVLEKRIAQAVNLLEQQVYIERNGEQYSYLTNEEKDVEQQIKSTQVEDSIILDELDKLMFTSYSLIKSNKIRYEANKQDFPFTRKIDNQTFGKVQEITLQLITPSYSYYDNEKQILANSMGKPELLIVMPPDNRFWEDLWMYKRTEKYCQQNSSTTTSESARKIVIDKQLQNNNRANQIRARFMELISQAKLIASGDLLEINPGDATSRIYEGCQGLISRIYPNLKMLKGLGVTDQDIESQILNEQETLDVKIPMSEAELGVFSEISLAQSSSRCLTLNNLIEKFGKRPYGWSESATICLIARLYSLNKVEIYYQSRPLEKAELVKTLKSKDKYPNLILQTQTEISLDQERKLKKLFSELLDTPNTSNDPKSISKELSDGLKVLADKLDIYYHQRDVFSFAVILLPAITQIREAVNKPFKWYYNEFLAQESQLKQLKTDMIDPVLRFFSSPQADIYKQIRSFLQFNEPNLSYLDEEAVKVLTEGISDPDVYRGGKIQTLKTQFDLLSDQLKLKLNAEIQATLKKVSTLKENLKPDIESIDPESPIIQNIEARFIHVSDAIKNAKLIAVIQTTLSRFEDYEYLQILNTLHNSKTKTDSPNPEPRIISSRSIKPAYTKGIINDRADLKSYLEALETALLNELDKGNKIKL